jgi:hypothetical protein
MVNYRYTVKHINNLLDVAESCNIKEGDYINTNVYVNRAYEALHTFYLVKFDSEVTANSTNYELWQAQVTAVKAEVCAVVTRWALNKLTSSARLIADWLCYLIHNA